MTWEEIDRIVARGGLTQKEERDHWGALYLTQNEVHDSLLYAREQAQRPFIHPMLLFTAHTGARCSEILRSQIDDFDFDSGSVRIREKKRSRSKSVTFRYVPMTHLLHEVMQDWFMQHPGGQFTISKETGEKTQWRRSEALLQAAFQKESLATSQRLSRIPAFFCFQFGSRHIDQRLIDEWMGHQTEEMRRRYRHLFPHKQRLAIDSVFGKEPVICSKEVDGSAA